MRNPEQEIVDRFIKAEQTKARLDGRRHPTNFKPVPKKSLELLAVLEHFEKM